MQINYKIELKDFGPKLESFWDLATVKIALIEKNFDGKRGSPVVTAGGIYKPKGWTEWTQGFQYGIPILVFDVTEDKRSLSLVKQKIIEVMLSHISHFGVHDHGFNIMSTYGNLLRLMNEGRMDFNEWERNYYILALKLSGGVQSKRWTNIKDGGFIYSFNGPHSLFVDTLRTCRILNVADMLSHKQLDENDKQIDLHERAVKHALATAKYSVFYDEGRDVYDERGRTAHESIFNVNDGIYRCPNSQQGYSGFSTWTRGLSWAMLGFTEFLEFEEDHHSNNDEIKGIFLKAATATCDFFIKYTSLDGIPYWDTGAPLLYKLCDYQASISNPFNEFEPVDSSASAIGAQGLLRLGQFLKKTDPENSKKYIQAGLTIAGTLLNEPYISLDKSHHGILLHTIYHRPNNWDHIENGAKIPYGESGMWGDYHMVELMYYLWKILKENEFYCFYKNLI